MNSSRALGRNIRCLARAPVPQWPSAAARLIRAPRAVAPEHFFSSFILFDFFLRSLYLTLAL
jgi:hypothetical protein